MSEFAFEPVHGLPENLPPGEALRWQGTPRWGALARRAFHVRAVAFYFGILILIQAAVRLAGGVSLRDTAIAAVWLVLLGLVAVGILALLAWLYSRATVYSITDRRVVIRSGVAISIAINIPFKLVESAGLRTYPDGSGDIPLTLGSGQKVSYLILWPNVRPWRLKHPEPMLRAIPDAAKVAELLAQALREYIAEHPAEEDAPQAKAANAAEAGSPGSGSGTMEPAEEVGR